MTASYVTETRAALPGLLPLADRPGELEQLNRAVDKFRMLFSQL
jgi:hypothetical protein